MLDQETEPLDDNIEKYACYWFSILKAIEKRTNWVFDDVDLLNGLYKFFVSKKWLRKDCLIQNGEAIFKSFGLKVTQKKTTYPFYDKDNPFSLAPEYLCAPNEIEILCYYWKEKGYFHFMLGDGKGNILYDPILRGSNTAKYGILYSKRVFVLEPMAA